MSLRGTWFVVPTPFGEGGALDLASQRSLVDAAVGWGVDGLTVLGVTSEASSLSEDERAAALEAILDQAAGRVPVAVGCSAAGADVVLERMEEAARRGAVAAMVSAPPGAEAAGVPGFFGRLADAPLPVVVQDEPAATGVRLDVETLLACVQACGGRTVKLEDPPTPPKIAALLAGDPSLSVFGGLGGAFVLGELRAGARGTMTGFAFPEILRAIREAVERGDDRAAAATYDRYLPLIQFEAQPGAGLAVRKALLRRRGAIACALTRGPIRTVDPVTARELDDVLRRVGVEPAPARLRV